jgi:uncharacterized repeat protein (TIGR01451 family)
MKINLLIFVCLIHIVSFAQPNNRSWVKGLGGTTGDIGHSVVTDNSGNIYVTGLFNGTIDFDPGHDIYNVTSISQDFFILKLNEFGEFQWVKSFQTTGTETGLDVTLDVNNNLVVCGQFSGTVDFDPGLSTFNLTSSALDIFVLKLNINGDFIWAKKFGSTGSDAAFSVTTDPIGNIICSGYFSGSVFGITSTGSADGFVLKLNSSGIQIWAKKFGGGTTGIIGNDVVEKIIVDDNSNIYAIGDFEGPADFDPNVGQYNMTPIGGSDAFIVKLDELGNFVWANSIGSTQDDVFNDVTIDNDGNIYTTGSYNNIGGSTDALFAKFSTTGNLLFNYIFDSGGSEQGHSVLANSNEVVLIGNVGGATMDINPDPNQVFNLSGYISYLATFDYFGNLLAVETFALNSGVSARGACFDQYNNIVTVGNFQGIKLFDTQNGLTEISSNGTTDIYIYKHKKSRIQGSVYNDFSFDCTLNTGESGMEGFTVTINPGNYVAQTNQSGIWSLDSLPPGSYTAWLDTTFGNDYSFCAASQTFTVASSTNITHVDPFGVQNNISCSDPNVSIYAPFLRRCFSNQKIYVSACNLIEGTGLMDSSYVNVALNSSITLNSATLPYTSLGNNIFKFETGILNPGQCVNFSLSTAVSCSAMNGQTLCMDATLYPIESCVLDTVPSNPPSGGDGATGTGGTLNGFPQPCTLPWDQSSLSVDGWCANDSIYFTITNTGEPGGGDMECYSPMWITVDGVVTYTDSIMIAGGETMTLAFPGDGATWILNAAQHPLHPGNSNPNAHVEACGDLSNWTPDLVNDFPLDDADPVVDIYCGVVTGSYDPNDKTGYPNGVTDQYYIQPNQQLQYVIRFQNTGTDTAFTVVIRDTLDIDLNIFTVTPGVSSHNYEFRMYGPRVLEWTFNNILLPDSTANSEASNGFVTFHVDQVNDLAPGTEITNDADIYFDFNDPITTNTTIHRIFEGFVSVLSIEELINEGKTLLVYPNPTTNNITIKGKEIMTQNFKVYDQMGREVLNGKLNGISTEVNLSKLSDGIYTLKIEGNYKTAQIVKQ